MLTVAVVQSFDNSAIPYTLCTSSFVDDIMFSHNGPYGAESKKRRYAWSSSPGGGTWGEVVVYDCRALFVYCYFNNHLSITLKCY